MPLHSVRFDDDTEDALDEVCKATGASVSVVLKRGVLALRDALATEKPRSFDVYSALDPGPGEYAKAPARRAKRPVVEIVRRKHRR